MPKPRKSQIPLEATPAITVSHIASDGPFYMDVPVKPSIWDRFDHQKWE